MYCAETVPVFNRPDLENVFILPLPLNENGLLKAAEYVAWQGTSFNILNEFENVYEVQLDAYPSPDKLYMPKQIELSCKQLQRTLPQKSTILSRLKEMIGAKYIWGGNYVKGIPKMLEWFPPGKDLSADEKKIWTFEGVDCSGLIYEASSGFTPRNTSQMHDFGKLVPQGAPLKPLDLILWEGHLVIVLDENTTIEARDKKGFVYTSPLEQRLKEAKEEAPNLVVRRWY